MHDIIPIAASPSSNGSVVGRLMERHQLKSFKVLLWLYFKNSLDLGRRHDKLQRAYGRQALGWRSSLHIAAINSRDSLKVRRRMEAIMIKSASASCIFLLAALASSARAEAIDAEIHLGLVPDDSTAATDNTAKLNEFFADPEFNYRPLFVPGKRFYIDNEIVIPQQNGAMVIQGAGGLSMAYTQGAGAAKIGAVSTFTWVGQMQGAAPTKAMFRVNGALCKMEGIVLEGAEVPTGGTANYPTAANRVANGIIIQHPDTPNDHSGKSVYRDMAFHFLNTGIKIHHAGTGDAETHADENLFENLHFDSVANPFLIDNLQSIGNRFEHIVMYSNVEGGVHKPLKPFDIRRAGQITINGLTVNGAGGTVFSIGAGGSDWFRRGGGQLSVRGLYVDSGAVSLGHTLFNDFKLIDIAAATVEADIDIEGTFSFDSTFDELERASVNGQTANLVLSTGVIVSLKTRRTNMPNTLKIVDDVSEGVILDEDTRELTVRVNISADNTTTHLAAVIDSSPDYRITGVSAGAEPIAETTTGDFHVITLDTPIIVTRGSDSIIQLNIQNLDAVNAAKYPRLAIRPLHSVPAYENGVHDYPLFMQPEVMPDLKPSDKVQSALEDSLLWVEARRIDTPEAAGNIDDDGAIEIWPDLSSSNNDLSQGMSTARPLFHRNLINHRPAAHFENPSNVDDRLEKTSPAGFTTNGGMDGPTDITFYIVYLPNNLQNDQTLVSMWTGTNQLSFRIYVDGSTIVMETSTSGSDVTSTSLSSGSSLLLNSPNLIVVSREADTGLMRAEVNGKLTEESGDTGALHKSTGPLRVSGYHDGSNNLEQVRGAIAAVVIDDSGTIDQNVADYLRAVYGCN